ncbi:hypothetical protein [Qipengyuania sp. 483]|tara:strand:+ start:2288 stop:2530 length:243 start_codon:yes stop_codon:yes gene_type:complete
MLIRRIEKFLRQHDMPATKFGRLAAHDPRFVLDLRNGREPRGVTEAHIRSFISGFDAAVVEAALADAQLIANAKETARVQ